MLQKNKKYEVSISGYTSEGSGIARVNGIAVFIPYALVGEKCLIKIVKPMKNFAWGKLEKVLNSNVKNHTQTKNPSCKRITLDCKVYKACGGCSLRHMSYNEELKFKLNKVQDALDRIGHQNIFVNQIHRSKKINRYRNKIELPVRKGFDDKIKIGLFKARSHDVINVDNCLLQNKKVSVIVKILKQWMEQNNITPYDEERYKGCIRHVCIRTNNADQIIVCLVTNQRKVLHLNKLIDSLVNNLDGLIGLILNYNNAKTNVIFGDKFKTIWGEDKITEEICGLKFELSSGSFFQINSNQAEILYAKALELTNIQKNHTVIDLYCGTGTITLLMAQHAKHAIGIEINKYAVKNAEKNAWKNNINNVEFICNDAAIASNQLLEKGQKPDVVCVDPPRKGLSAQSIQVLKKLNPKTITYISCNPATLARDIHLLCGGTNNTDNSNLNKQNELGKSNIVENPYRVEHIEAVDMFPRTPHVETIAILKLKEGI